MYTWMRTRLALHLEKKPTLFHAKLQNTTLRFTLISECKLLSPNMSWRKVLSSGRLTCGCSWEGRAASSSYRPGNEEEEAEGQSGCVTHRGVWRSEVLQSKSARKHKHISTVTTQDWISLLKALDFIFHAISFWISSLQTNTHIKASQARKKTHSNFVCLSLEGTGNIEAIKHSPKSLCFPPLSELFLLFEENGCPWSETTPQT